MQPSKSSYIAIVLFESNITDYVVDVMIRLLTDLKKEFRTVCFIGATSKIKRKIINKMPLDVSFQKKFIDDMEKAKEWLLP